MQEEFSRVSPSQDHERGSDGARLKLAILDDYQGVALAMADWSALESRIDITVFRDTVEDQETLAQRLAPFSVACLRSEEHTSELQSLMRHTYAVFCLKKKKVKPAIPQTPSHTKQET